jgi:hypothetical protein
VGGKSLYEIGEGAWNLADLKKSLDAVLPENTSLEGLRVKHAFPDGARRTFILNARRLDDAVWFPGRILLAIEVVAE